MAGEGCIFCRVVRGEILSHKVYEDGKYVAILDIFPIVDGQTLVIPKRHTQSYIFDVDDAEVGELMGAAKKVAKMLERGLGVNRINLIFEGLDVDHLHAKLYPGPLGTRVGKRADDRDLERIAKRIKGVGSK